jgi:small subunit ribosomal protein S5
MKKGQAPIKEVKEFEEEVIQIDRVTRVVKGGRRLRFRATVVIGNKKGKVGVGIGKSTEVTGAISKAIAQAKKSLITVPMAGQTIPHRISIKFKSAKVLLMPACPGTGIKAGGSIRKVIELAGIKDIMSKALGAPNRLNNSQATLMALGLLKPIPWLKIKAPLKEEIKAPLAPAHQDRPFRPGKPGQKRPNDRNFDRKPFTKPLAKPEVKDAAKPAVTAEIKAEVKPENNENTEK